MSLTLDELESHLYGCADKIRNAVDKTDYKDFILPLVFYKTISDTFQDELEKWADELGDEELAPTRTSTISSCRKATPGKSSAA
jgi:type I restriction enzyme M protein